MRHANVGDTITVEYQNLLKNSRDKLRGEVVEHHPCNDGWKAHVISLEGKRYEIEGNDETATLSVADKDELYKRVGFMEING